MPGPFILMFFFVLILYNAEESEQASCVGGTIRGSDFSRIKRYSSEESGLTVGPNSVFDLVSTAVLYPGSKAAGVSC